MEITYLHFVRDAKSPNGLRAESNGTVISFATDEQFQAEFDRIGALTRSLVPGLLAYAIGTDAAGDRWGIHPTTTKGEK